MLKPWKFECSRSVQEITTQFYILKSLEEISQKKRENSNKKNQKRKQKNKKQKIKAVSKDAKKCCNISNICNCTFFPS